MLTQTRKSLIFVNQINKICLPYYSYKIVGRLPNIGFNLNYVTLDLNKF